jgi:small-conductance mechanosensitive channel
VGVLLCGVVFLLALRGTPAQAQTDPDLPFSGRAEEKQDDTPQAPKAIDVQPVARDAEIRNRLLDILQATTWFENPQVDVREGVVFLDGRTGSKEYKTWAKELASHTQDVVAVVNRIAIIQRSPWDFSPAWDGLRRLWRELVQMLPFVGFALVVLTLTWWATKLASRLARHFFQSRITSALLRNVVAKAVSLPVFLIGLYIVLHIAGLTRLALTVVGSTGVAGLVIGIAFRDIMENFLASILISMQRPFQLHDLIEVDSHTGLVQSMTTRGTVLMSLDGNHIQIPNATIYKHTIRNYTANPNRRGDFVVGIGYDDAIPMAQEVIMQVLTNHPTILREPLPAVLVDALGAATVNLRVLFWLDGVKHDYSKTKSSVIRMVKRALQDAGISMPDESREVVFPNGVPVRMLAERLDRAGDGGHPSSPPSALVPDPVSTTAEGDLGSETERLQDQARRARPPEEGMNLLEANEEQIDDQYRSSTVESV